MKYLAFYDIKENESENRIYFPASTNKIKYICECIDKLNMSCEIISLSGTRLKVPVSKKIINISKNITLQLPKSFGQKNKIIKVFDRWQIRLITFLKLLKMEKNEVLIAYHSLLTIRMVKMLKRIKKIKLILEIEEIYGDVTADKTISRKELEYFKLADGYIFSTELLNKKINLDNKPSVVSYGTYRVEDDSKCGFDDEKIHVVYAGTFDSNKGGAQAALSAVPYLSSKYHVHIIGFGNNRDTENVKNEIKKLSESSKCKITYDGLKSGEEYIRFLQSCHIGMSTQNPNGTFNDTSFPSKVLSYLSNGLHVVSVKIPVVEQSAIGHMVHFYSENDGELIAKAISDINIDLPYNSRATINKLDEEFILKINNLLETLK